MKWREFQNLHLEDYYWRLLFGPSKKRASFFELRASGFKDMPAPVFFLSTGRCGTNWFTKLLSEDRSLKVFHEPRPNLGIQGKVAWELYTVRDFSPSDSENSLLEEVFLAAREQYLRYSYKTQRRFVETNNQITFLAPAIRNLFPDTKFVHLNRHPGEFVRSALRRNFYNNPDDIKRIAPTPEHPDYKKWESFDPVQKNAWLWKETNEFIERFKKSVSKDKQFYFDFTALSVEQVEELIDFLGTSISVSSIKKQLHQPVNVQKTGSKSRYDEWSKEDRNKLQAICRPLAQKYNYEL
jgi:hypothetical protein